MKKKMVLALFAVSMLLLVGCGEQQSANKDNDMVDNEQDNVLEEDKASDESQLAGSETLKILQTVWNAYDENDKFSAGGGDSHNMVMDEPGTFDVTNTDELNVTLGFPSDYADKIDEAASLMHMLNANTFTGGAYHVVNKEDVTMVADALKENILGRQWMCGFPEKMIVVVVDDNYVISAFGLGEQIEKFKSGIENSYENTEILYEENI